MSLKKIAMLSLITISTSPLFTYAVDIKLNNETDSYGTGAFGYMCSGTLGDKGVVKPHQPDFDVSNGVLSMFCSPNCEAEVYLNKSCAGNSFATVEININTGVTRTTVHDNSKYEIVGLGTNITIKPVSTWQKLFNLFS